MKQVIVAVAVVVAAIAARADGFECINEAGDLKVTVYNHTQASEGTRSAAVMVVSNPLVGEGNKTIARFTDVNGRVESRNMVYTGDVDLRFNDSSKAGRLIGGTKLGQLDQIVLDIAFSYSPSQVLAEGETTTAVLKLVKRPGAGQDLVADMTCTRYLKGE